MRTVKNKLFDITPFINHIKYLQYGNFFDRNILFPIRLFKWWVMVKLKVYKKIHSKEGLNLKELIYEFGLMMFELHSICGDIFDSAGIVESHHGRVQMEVIADRNKDPSKWYTNNNIDVLTMFISIKMPMENLLKTRLVCVNNLGDIEVSLYINEFKFFYLGQPINQRYIIVPKSIEKLLRRFVSDVVSEMMKRCVIKL